MLPTAGQGEEDLRNKSCHRKGPPVGQEIVHELLFVHAVVDLRTVWSYFHVRPTNEVVPTVESCSIAQSSDDLVSDMQTSFPSTHSLGLCHKQRGSTNKQSVHQVF